MVGSVIYTLYQPDCVVTGEAGTVSRGFSPGMQAQANKTITRRGRVIFTTGEVVVPMRGLQPKSIIAEKEILLQEAGLQEMGALLDGKRLCYV